MALQKLPLHRRLAKTTPLLAKRLSFIGLFPTNAAFLWNAMLIANVYMGDNVLWAVLTISPSAVPDEIALLVLVTAAHPGAVAASTSALITLKMHSTITKSLLLTPDRV